MCSIPLSYYTHPRDCNGPSSWQRFMTYVFRERIGVEVWVYLDDIYIFSKTLEQHENALGYVYDCLYKEQLYISPNKFKPYAIRFNCLGHYRDERGLTASTDEGEENDSRSRYANLV